MRQLWEVALEQRQREQAAARENPRRRPRSLALTPLALSLRPVHRFEFAERSPDSRAKYASRRFRDVQ